MCRAEDLSQRHRQPCRVEGQQHDGVEEEQRASRELEPRQPHRQHTQDGNGEPPVAAPQPPPDACDECGAGHPPQHRGAKAGDHPKTGGANGLAPLIARFDVVLRVDADRSNHHQPAQGVGLVGVLRVDHHAVTRVERESGDVIVPQCSEVGAEQFYGGIVRVFDPPVAQVTSRGGQPARPRCDVDGDRQHHRR